jgi:tetratricopeptide (TPR) repeat protein
MDPGTAAAIKTATEQVLATPDDPEVWQRLAAVHLAHERFDDAHLCYDHLQNVLPNDAKVFYYSALVHDKLGNDPARRVAIDRAVQLDSTSSIPQWRGALWALETGELDRAAALADQAGTSSSALKVRALIHLAKNDSKEALSLLQQADQSDPYATYLLGRALQANGQRAEANRALLLAGDAPQWFLDPWAEAIAKHRADYAVHSQGLKQLVATNDLDAALARVDQLLQVYGARRNLRLMRVNILMRQGKDSPAAQMTQQLLEDFPEWAPAHIRMATILRTTRTRPNIERAMNYAQTATTLAPGSVEAWFTLAGLAASLKEYEQAKLGFDRCIALDPSRAAYRGGLIDMLIAVGDLSEADAAIIDQEGLFGESIETKLLRVRWLDRSDRREEAIVLYQQCQKAAPNHPSLSGIGRMLGATP